MRKLTSTITPVDDQMRRLNVVIPSEAFVRLDALARRSYRDRKQQAALLLVDAIERADREVTQGISDE